MDNANITHLPVNLHSSAGADLLENFARFRGSDLIVSGSDVRKLGAQCLQILLSAKLTWAADGKQLTFVNFSNELVDALGWMGASTMHLPYAQGFPT